MCALEACTGWSTESLILGGMEKVYVPYFQNDTFYRRLEHDLTRQVIARINERPDVYLADEESAELILEGRIRKYHKSVLGEGRHDEVLEGAATVTVEINIIRAADGVVLRTEILRDTAEYFEGLGETLEMTRGESFDVLAGRIVALLEKSF